METMVNQSKIIVLSLIYTYISNGEEHLDVEKFWKFRDRLQYEVYHNARGGQFVFSLGEEEQDFYNVDYKNKMFIIRNTYDFDSYQEKIVKEIPKQVIDASLNQTLLSLIDVDLEKIKTEVAVVHKRETTKNYSDSRKAAVKREIEYHEELGHKNVQIEAAHYCKIDSCYGYEITTSWDEEYTRFVIEKPKTYSKGFLSSASKEFLNSIGDDSNE